MEGFSKHGAAQTVGFGRSRFGLIAVDEDANSFVTSTTVSFFK